MMLCGWPSAGICCVFGSVEDGSGRTSYVMTDCPIILLSFSCTYHRLNPYRFRPIGLKLHRLRAARSGIEHFT